MAADWANFEVVSGSAAGALTGLLFVAVSLNRERIAGHRGLRAQAGQTLVLFMIPLLLSLLVTLPGLSTRALGTALVVFAAVAAVALIFAGRGAGKLTGDGSEDRLARVLDRVSPNLVVVVLVLVGAGLQLAGDDGLYWTAAASALALTGGVVNAWLFLTRS